MHLMVMEMVRGWSEHMVSLMTVSSRGPFWRTQLRSLTPHQQSSNTAVFTTVLNRSFRKGWRNTQLQTAARDHAWTFWPTLTFCALSANRNTQLQSSCLLFTQCFDVNDLTAVQVHKLLGTLRLQLPAKKLRKKYLHPTHMEMGRFSSPKGSFNKKKTKAIYYFLKTLYAKKYLTQAFQRNLYGTSPGFLDPVTKLRLPHRNKEGSTSNHDD